MLKTALLVLCLVASARAQTKDAAPRTLANSTSLPATCTVGSIFFKSDATAGQNLYYCTATNTWTQQLNSGAGGGVPNPSANGLAACTGTNCSTASARTITAGTGIGVTNGDGVAGNPTVAISAATQTKAGEQTGTSVYAVSSTGTTMTAALTPTLTAYTTGMRVFLVSTTATTTTGTLNIDALGAITLKAADCSTQIGSGVVANQGQWFWYNGTNFCQTTPPAGTAYITKTCQPGLGDGTNAIAAATYLMSSCYNAFGSTWTITSIKCFTDNNGSSTLAVTNGAGTALLTGAITCSNSFASGTQSGTTTLASADFAKWTFVADGTSKQTTFVLTGTF